MPRLLRVSLVLAIAGSWPATPTPGTAAERGQDRLVAPAGTVLDIRDFGAVDGDQTLIDVNHMVGSGLEFNVTQQTRTGLAIQDAIDEAGRRGGGTVFVPAGTWYVYSYVQVKHPNVRIVGTGDASVLKSAPTAPAEHGYGILLLGFWGPGQPEKGFTGLAVRDLRLDGNITSRGKPAAEFQMYNLAVYGEVVRATIQNVTSVDSGIDCLMLFYGNNDDSGVVVSDCVLKGAFRNTASFCGGNNIRVRNTVFEDAGLPFGGTNPRYCLDIEPNHATDIISHVVIEGCTFRNARNCAAGVVWARDVRFANCLFQAGKDTCQGILFITSQCDVTVSHSTFDGSGFAGCYLLQMAAARPENRDLKLSNRLVLEGNRFNKVGGEIQGHTAVIRDNVFLNARKALWVMAPFAVVENNLMVNCGWGAPNGGRFSSLCIGYNTDAARRYVVSGNLVRFNEDHLDFDIHDIPADVRYCGIYIQDINAEIQLLNNRAEGFYRFPDARGLPRSENHFRDWAMPGLPPPDSRTPTNAVTGNTHGGPGWHKESEFR